MSGRKGLEEHCEADVQGKGQTTWNGSGQGASLSGFMEDVMGEMATMMRG